MASPITSRLRAIWAWLPFPEMTVLVLALFIIKEQFPFSNFPMYSNIDVEADVVYVADQKDAPLPMKAVFKTSSGTSKKMFNTEVKKITNPKGRDSDDATEEELKQAGQIMMDTLMKRLEKGALPQGTTALRFYRRTFRAGETGVGDHPPIKLAEVTL